MRRPMVIGICGAIGSGKSIVRQALSIRYSWPAFDTDSEAKALYHAPDVRNTIRATLGIDPIGEEGRIDKQALQTILSHPSQRTELEHIVHAALEQRLSQWLKGVSAPAVLLESAILYTSGYDQYCDTVVTVTAPTALRRERVAERDGDSTGGRFDRIDALQAEERALQESRADYVITNDGRVSIIEQIEALHRQLHL